MQATDHQEKKADYYDQIYGAGYDTTVYYPIYNEVMQLLAAIGTPRVLELGCGIGDLGHLITERGYPYRGFDFSEEAIKQCKKRCPDGDFRVGNVYEPDDYKPYDYNVVVSLEVLEHVDDLKVISLIPAGVRLIASVPNYDDAAHLRLYLDPQQDIVERFRTCLHVIDVRSAIGQRTTSSDSPTIHMFQGIKLIT